MLRLTNGTQSPINVVPGSVTVRTDRGDLLQVLSRDDLHAMADKERDSAVRRHAIGRTLFGPSSSDSSVTSTTTATISGYGPGGPVNYSVAATNTEIDPVASRLEAQQTAQAEADWGADLQMSVAGLHAQADELGFVPQTVAPGQSYTTTFVVEPIPKRTKNIEVTVRVGAEAHHFKIDVAEQ